MIRKTLAVAALATVAFAVTAQAADQIRIVGSSTVYPFSTAVAEQFGKTSGFKTPVVESTGTGGGLKLFCAGNGPDSPSITNASRRIKQSEIDNCATNGVKDVAEVVIGYDGIVVAKSKNGKPLSVTREQLFKVACDAVREDGAFIEVSENYTVTLQKLMALPNAVGILTYSYLDQNGDKIQGATVDGQIATYDNIATGKYPLSRPLFFYVKKDHVGKIAGIKEYIGEFSSDKAWGKDGYLAEKGLIAMPDAQRKAEAQKAKDLPNVKL